MGDPQHGIRVWMESELARMGHGSSRLLARHLGIKPHVVSKLKNTDGMKETRRIEAHIVPSLAVFFGSIPPGFERVADLKCNSCALYDKAKCSGPDKKTAMANDKQPKGITIKIETPQQGTLVVGDNNTVTTTNNQTVMSRTTLSPEQALRLDQDVKEIAAAKKADVSEVWKDLCTALDVPDSALITREIYPIAEKVIARWKGAAIRTAINEKGGG